MDMEHDGDETTDPDSTDLAGAIKKRGPFEAAEQEVYLNLVRTSEALLGEFGLLFKSHGLSSASYNVLRILRGAGDEGLPCQEVGARMVSRLPDVTRLVDRLEQSGLVERARVEHDRRVVLIRITPQGLEKLKGLDEPVLELHKRQLGHLPKADLAELNRLLVLARKRP